MLKALRNSTLKQRESREEIPVTKRSFKSQVRLKRRSRKLSEIIREEEDLFRQDLQELYQLSTQKDKEPEETSRTSSIVRSAVISAPDPTSPATHSVGGSNESLTWDNQADLNSPLKDTSDILDNSFIFGDIDTCPPALSRDRSVSVSVNRANYEAVGAEVNLHPVCRNLNRHFLASDTSDNNPELITQDSILERNLAIRERDTVLLVGDDIQEDLEKLSEDIEILEVEEIGNKMDDTDYEAKLKALKGSLRRVEHKILDYGPNVVTVIDQEEYKGQLKEIRLAFNTFSDLANDLLDKLGDNTVDEERVITVNKLIEDLRSKLQNNEVAVKNKVAEVMSAYEANKPMSAADKKEESLKVEKVKKRMGFIKEKATEAKKKIMKVKAVNEMNDIEIRECMMESKNWESLVKEIVNSKEKAEEDAVGIDISSQELLEMKEVVQEAVDALTMKMDNLKLEDRNRGLHSAINTRTAKESVVFPDAFEGKRGENVYKFKQKFEEAVADAQVREKDKVEVLRKHLVGEAKKLIGDHHVSLETAMQTLIDYFGQPDKIWEKSKVKFMEDFGDVKAWGFYGSQTRVVAIAGSIEFLREAEELAKTYPELKNEVYNSSTSKLLKRAMPKEYIEKINDLISGCRATEKEKIENIREFLEAKKDSAVNGVDDFHTKKNSDLKPSGHTTYGGFEDEYEGSGKTQREYKGKRGSRREYEGSKGAQRECNYCKGKTCKRQWDALGCKEMYEQETLEDRLEWLTSRSLCYKCGGNFQYSQNKPHNCDWLKVGKLYSKCNRDGCRFAAVTCKSHKQNMSPELIKWLNNVKVDIKHLTQIAIYSPAKIELIDMSYLRTNNSQSQAKKTVTPQERAKLQEGKMDLQMSDDELVDFFNEDLKKTMKTTPEVRPIPKGDAVFIFCVFKGKKGPVQAFIDHGCNCWVAEEGIPETELVACKLQNGPFPMGVASGVTVYASAEWAGLIPLADGSHQVVRGLTVPKVTQDMPKVDLHTIYENLKKKCKSKKQIQKLKVPKIVGGKVQMILGIKYQNIFPEPIHTFPSGLTIFKSKLMPAYPGAVACIGGPVAAIGELAGVMGLTTTTYLTNLLVEMKNYRPRMEFFPDMDDKIYMQDQDIPGIKEVFADMREEIDIQDEDIVGIDEVFDVDDDNKPNAEIVSLLCTVCGVVENKVAEHFGGSIQSEFQKFMQLQEVGLDASYKCPTCRECESCKKGSGFENISIKQEAEQELIKQSVYVDTELNRPMARLPFKADPKVFLADNNYIASKRLQNVCNKYYKQEAVREEINHAFDKLRKRGHMKYYKDLNVNQREKLTNAETGYTIPWDVVWKESSLSTPARLVFDASSKTSTGYSLNDILPLEFPI